MNWNQKVTQMMEEHWNFCLEEMFKDSDKILVMEEKEKNPHLEMIAKLYPDQLFEGDWNE